MRFICTQENLLEGLSSVAPIAGRNKQLPVLNHLLCQIKDGVLHLTATDLEIGIRTTVAGKMEEEGSCTVPARKLLDYVQQLPATNPLQLQRNENRLSLSTEGFQAHFPVAQADEFPLLPVAETTQKLTLNAELLCQGLQSTAFAAARDATRPEIHSVFVIGEGTTLRLAATDSFRLVEEIITLDEPVERFSFLLPLTTTHEVIRLFSSRLTLVVIPHTNYITFQEGGAELSSRLMEGTYPEYQQIIPTRFAVEGTIEREALVRALKTLLVFLPRDSRRVTMQFLPSDEVIRLRVGGEAGEGEVTVPFSGEGEGLEVLFNIQYVLEGIQRLPSSQCRMQVGGVSEPVVFRPVGGERQYLYVVMPIQL